MPSCRVEAVRAMMKAEACEELLRGAFVSLYVYAYM